MTRKHYNYQNSEKIYWHVLYLSIMCAIERSSEKKPSTMLPRLLLLQMLRGIGTLLHTFKFVNCFSIIIQYLKFILSIHIRLVSRYFVTNANTSIYIFEKSL